MAASNAVYTTDEYGRPFIIIREQQNKARLSGTEAQKVLVSTRSGC
jgi:T-complex protein 1 subunit epsilon